MMIDNAESKILAQAISDVQSHYNYEVSQDVAIWVNFATAMGTVYGPRIAAYMARRKIEKLSANKPAPAPRAPDNVVPFNNPLPGMHDSTVIP